MPPPAGRCQQRGTIAIDDVLVPDLTASDVHDSDLTASDLLVIGDLVDSTAAAGVPTTAS